MQRASGTKVGLARCFVAALLAAFIATNLPAFAQAPLPDTPEAFGVVLMNWAAKYGVQQALVAVRREGRIVYRSAIGGANPNAAVHLASLSKAITGACTATLIRDGKLAFDTPLSSALARFFAAYGKPADTRLAKVTVEQLLTHRAGFGSNVDNADPVIGPNLVAYLKVNSARQPPKPVLLANAFKTRLPYEPGTQYAYSNTAYLVLGAIIEQATGKPYFSYCSDVVLRPLGVTGGFEPAWQVLGAYGGWRMAADGYLSILDLFDATDQRLGTGVKKWMLSSEGKTTAPDSPVWYGLGTNVREAGGGVNVWHWGSWRYNLTGAKDGVLKASFVTFAVRANDGAAWFVYASPRVEFGAPRLELDRALFNAYRAVKRWN